jgi:hypothetical protein
MRVVFYASILAGLNRIEVLYLANPVSSINHFVDFPVYAGGRAILIRINLLCKRGGEQEYRYNQKQQSGLFHRLGMGGILYNAWGALCKPPGPSRSEPSG